MEGLIAMDARLSLVLAGKAEPVDIQERVAMAELAIMYKKYNVAATQFYARAFADAPELTTLLDKHRYNAACAAALAGCGRGKDAVSPQADERTAYRRRALGWLRAELAGWAGMVGEPAATPRIRRVLQHWFKDSDLVGVRDQTELVKLPPAERVEWEKLWAEVRQLQARLEN
jgi:hypothetical protein